jgi:3-hydroxyisobutyrate dehydrogenase
MNKIAVLGLGKMGSGIASSLLRAGYAVTVWNRTREKAQPLLDQGATWAATPMEAATGKDALISMVSDDPASKAVWLGPDGAMQQMKPGSFLIECSTISFAQVGLLELESTKRGIQYIDCPVTGWPEHAASGSLTLLVGAHAKDFSIAEKLLQAFAKSIILFGEPGKGTAYKLMINLMGAVQIAALAEGISLSEKLGLKKEQVIKAIETSVAASPQVIKNASVMAERNYEDDPHFTLGLRLKDTVYAIDLAKQFSSNVLLGETAWQLFDQAARTNPARDQAAVIEVIAGENNIPG